LIIPSRSYRVYAGNPSTGKLAWTFSTRLQANGAPTLSGGLAWFGSDEGVLYAVRVSDGALVWKLRLGSKLRSGIAIAGGRLLLGAEDGRLVCLGA
jgi:outer membrane protein assembly factor BamB